MKREESYLRPLASLRVIGIGGGGINALNRLAESGVQGIDLVALSSDICTLAKANVPVRLCMGQAITKGTGCGGDPTLGEQAALASQAQIRALLAGADMVFITAGMGGGTGTGAAPVVAAIARSLGILTIAVVTTPFHFEGSYRIHCAEAGIQKLKHEVDTLLVVPNERSFAILDDKVSLRDAYSVANQVLQQGIQGISELITTTGFINLDFADVRTVMMGGGATLISVGKASGQHRAQVAAEQATYSHILNTTIDGARALLINITAGPNLTLHEVQQAVGIIESRAHTDVNVIFGTVIDENAADELRITVIATGCGWHPQDMTITAPFLTTAYQQEHPVEVALPRFSLRDYRLPVLLE